MNVETTKSEFNELTGGRGEDRDLKLTLPQGMLVTFPPSLLHWDSYQDLIAQRDRNSVSNIKISA